MQRLALWRVPLGFVCAAAALALARPTWASWSIGFGMAVLGEVVRVWAAGHLERWRGVTRSGPYRLVQHPLYLGSVLLGAGFAVASHRLVVVILVAAYLAATLSAAIRRERRELSEWFRGAYADYRTGRTDPGDRRFSWGRAMANREYRAIVGVAAVFAFLVWRIGR